MYKEIGPGQPGPFVNLPSFGQGQPRLAQETVRKKKEGN